MQGGYSLKGKNKLVQVMHCFKHLIKFLGNDDRFSVFLFALETRRLFGLLPMNRVNRHHVCAALTTHMCPDGGTDLLKGF
jgi:hypothetical protein